MYIHASVTSNKGLVRSNNEDNIFFNNKIMTEVQALDYHDTYYLQGDDHMFVVCDGMGGQKYGEKASYCAVNEVQKYYAHVVNTDTTIERRIEEIKKVILRANEEINKLSEVTYKSDLGTTFACLQILGNVAVAMNLGDSRIYLFRAGKLVKLSEDHIESEKMVKFGVLTPEQAKTHKSRHVLLRYLGLPLEEGEIEASVSPVLKINEGDIFVICSDGLTDMVDDEKIAEILSGNENIEAKGKKLVGLALKNGGKDNVTVMVVEVFRNKPIAKASVSNAITQKINQLFGNKLLH